MNLSGTLRLTIDTDEILDTLNLNTNFDDLELNDTTIDTRGNLVLEYINKISLDDLTDIVNDTNDVNVSAGMTSYTLSKPTASFNSYNREYEFTFEVNR